MKTTRSFAQRPAGACILLAFAGLFLALGGCNKKAFLDPSELMRAEGTRLVVPILVTLDPLDEPLDEFPTASDLRRDDLVPAVGDYVIGKNDLISVAVMDLFNNGVESVRTARVSESGNLSLPLLNEPIVADGLTEMELQKAIASKYKDAGLIPNAQITVTVIEARNRTFSAMGAVGRPGQFAIVESDFRMLDAFIQCGDVTNPTAEYCYIIRKTQKASPSTRPASQPAIASDETEEDYVLPADAAHRIIRVPIQPLKNGDLRYNAVVKADDKVVVPQPVIGEYYMGGHVSRPGVYSLSGRKITLKQAVISAGMLDSLAIPQRADVIRRIGKNEEVFVRVDLAKVFEGVQPDIYLQPNDVITVGTHPVSPLLLSIRTGLTNMPANAIQGFLWRINW